MAGPTILGCLALPARALPLLAPADSQPATDEDAPFDFDQRTPYDDS